MVVGWGGVGGECLMQCPRGFLGILGEHSFLLSFRCTDFKVSKLFMKQGSQKV